MNLPLPFAGLSDEEACRRLAAHGPNEIEASEKRGLGATVKGVATEPMFLLLVVAAVIYLLLGDLGEGLLLACFALVTVGLVILQERRSAHALDALRDLAAPQVRAVRGGRVVRIAARELVPGDLFLLAEGERIAADGLLREAVGVSVDESLLTGESMPVRKPSAGEGSAPAAADHAPQVFAGTLVVAGHGLVEVQVTGSQTRVGRIGVSLADIETAPTPLQQQLRGLVRVFGLVAVGAISLLFIWHGLRGEWMQGVLAGITLGMAMVPEEFPMALAVFLALGAWRLARIEVLSRRPAVIEALGATTVLCVDKTGTLTENRMRLQRLVTDSVQAAVVRGQPLPEPVHRLLEYAMLASRRGGADPMDRALLEQGDATLADTEHLHPLWQLEHEYPLTPALLAMSHAWTGDDGRRRVAAKGAPEAVIDLCHLPPEQAVPWLDRVRQLAAQGLRVLAVAEGTSAGGAMAASQHDYDFRMLGLLGFEDPLRASVPAAVAQAREAGISVAMITGDHAATALAIAGQAGIDVAAGSLSGEAIDLLDDAALALALRSVRVFARVTPEQKLRLVEAFQRNGETVAMTGDGINDAPALKAAHIGIAMGARGTDVAREAAGLVLLDEDFGRIVGGVRMGRRIYDNLRKVMTYIMAIHVPVAGLSLLPVMFGLPPLMLPAHVVLTQMVIDPVCAVAFESAPEDPQVMSRPPRRADERLVGWPVLAQGLVQGGCLLLATLAIYVVAWQLGRGEDIARTLAVVGLTAGNLLLVAVNATSGAGWRALFLPTARALWWIAAGASVALAAGVALPGARRLLHFGLPTASDLIASLVTVLVAVAVGAILGAGARRA